MEEVLDEEGDAYENLSEGLQDTELGEQMQENIEILGEILDHLEEAEDSPEDI